VRKKRGCLIEKKKRNWEKMVLTAEKKNCGNGNGTSESHAFLLRKGIIKHSNPIWPSGLPV
jgi:hypothetical protein